jgi:hypothetical protein
MTTKQDTTDAIDTALAPKRKARSEPTKADKVGRLLGRAKGATLNEICATTGWQPHSARASLSGLRKRGLSLVKEQRADGETAYRLVPTQQHGASS